MHWSCAGIISDNVLHIITEFLKEQVSDDMTILADVTDQYRLPPSLAPSDLWPDLVAYSELTKTPIIIALTVCFETHFEEAKEREESKYRNLIGEVEGNDFVVDFLTRCTRKANKLAF